jgi:cell division protein FtsI (penicillin-binding protein 3)
VKRAASISQTSTYKQPLSAPVRRIRFVGVAVFFLVWASLIVVKLVWLQVMRHREFVERAQKQQQRTFEVAPRRGVLYDRNLRELAMTVLVDSVYAVPSEMSDKQEAAAALAKIVHVDPTDSFTSEQQIATRLNASRNFAWIARKLDPEASQKVKALNLKGIYFQKEFKRFYPNNEIAAQVLGYVGVDDNGLGGLEQKYDQRLHGVPGRMLTALDARRHSYGSQEQEPKPGANLVLTLDENIQFMAERALDHAMQKTRALNGTIVVQDVHSGQILALAIRPTFNPNDFRHATTELLRDHAVSDIYEPGSTFKLVTLSSALEEKLTNPNEVFDCQMGKIVVNGRLIHDWRPFGALSTSGILWNSSDVGSIKIGLRLGDERFYKYIRAYGFGDRSGIELPAETRGLIKPPKRWSPSSIGSVSIGQEVGVTPIQLISMVSTIANGGVYLPPRMLLQITNEMRGSDKLKPTGIRSDGQLPDPLPEGAHRVISTMTAAQMRKMMEGVVLFGTGRLAQLNGYSAGGKSGTAQKIDVRTHTYSKTNYIASFAGIAPINNPVIAIAVIVDSPQDGGHHGGQVGGPIFGEVAQQVLEYLSIPHDMEVKSPALLAKAKETDLTEEPTEHSGDLNALFAEVNDLPADDPLRNPQPVTPVKVSASSTAAPAASMPMPTPSEPTLKPKEEPEPPAPGPLKAPLQQFPGTVKQGAVVLDSGKRIAVPSLIGLPVRKVVEQAGVAGLGVQILGNGIVREQAPAPGTMVPAGTQVIVRCER